MRVWFLADASIYECICRAVAACFCRFEFVIGRPVEIVDGSCCTKCVADALALLVWRDSHEFEDD